MYAQTFRPPPSCLVPVAVCLITTTPLLLLCVAGPPLRIGFGPRFPFGILIPHARREDAG